MKSITRSRRWTEAIAHRFLDSLWETTRHGALPIVWSDMVAALNTLPSQDYAKWFTHTDLDKYETTGSPYPLHTVSTGLAKATESHMAGTSLNELYSTVGLHRFLGAELLGPRKVRLSDPDHTLASVRNEEATRLRKDILGKNGWKEDTSPVVLPTAHQPETVESINAATDLQLIRRLFPTYSRVNEELRTHLEPMAITVPPLGTVLDPEWNTKLEQVRDMIFEQMMEKVDAMDISRASDLFDAFPFLTDPDKGEVEKEQLRVVEDAETEEAPPEAEVTAPFVPNLKKKRVEAAREMTKPKPPVYTAPVKSTTQHVSAQLAVFGFKTRHFKQIKSNVESMVTIANQASNLTRVKLTWRHYHSSPAPLVFGQSNPEPDMAVRGGQVSRHEAEAFSKWCGRTGTPETISTPADASATLATFLTSMVFKKVEVKVG